MKRVGKSERRGLGARVDLLLHVFQRFARGLKPGFRDRILHLHHDDADILRAADAAEARQQIFFAVAQFAVDDDDRFRAVIAGVDGLGDQLRMLRQSVIAALFCEARRLVAQHNDDLVFDVEAGVVVVVEFVGGGAVSGEDERRRDLAGGRKAEGDEILIDLQILLRISCLHRDWLSDFKRAPVITVNGCE